MKTSYLASAIKRFEYYKTLEEKTFDQLTEAQLFWQPDEESNSIAILVQHLWGNMLSRWTDFLTTDGEKDWRNRDAEFEKEIKSKEELMQKWHEGWRCLLDALHSITDKDLDREIFIRHESHSVLDAINRQLAHYPYHVGQIVYIGKLLRKQDWQSLSIPKGKSAEFNVEKGRQAGMGK
ncbi:DUF1572 family protein [Pontibacter litorisediminis]|uniref:DUF1572 family protein n=1 Tax=Pontibacter litorisediminis TaxID=1846260 RepID=UPI0023ECFB5F|nr:DUF1572 family protein [Pontibacter litorisediminis]